MTSKNETVVRRTIQNYIDGTYRADVKLLKNCFHSTAVMNGYFNGQLLMGSPEPFFQDIQSKPSMASGKVPYKGEITSIETTEKTACVTLKESGFGGGINFTNFFHLVCIEGEWKITSKTFITT